MTFLDTEPLKPSFKFTELQLLGQKLGTVHTIVTIGRGGWSQEDQVLGLADNFKPQT